MASIKNGKNFMIWDGATGWILMNEFFNQIKIESHDML